MARRTARGKRIRVSGRLIPGKNRVNGPTRPPADRTARNPPRRVYFLLCIINGFAMAQTFSDGIV